MTDAPHPPDASVSVVALEEAGTVKVTWSEPELKAGQEINGYSVKYKSKGSPTFLTRSVSGSSNTSYTITNLELGTEYEVRVASVGPLGLKDNCYGGGKRVTTLNSE